MPISVRELRLALIWTQAGAADLPLALGSPERYEVAFDRVHRDAGAWTLPWHAASADRRRFWLAYLESPTLAAITWERAWRHLMPLRARPLAQITPQDLPATLEVRSAVEGFGYPHGAGVVVTLAFRTPQPLADLVDTLVAARQSRYQVTWRQESANQLLTLDDLATQVLIRLSRELAGSMDVPAIRAGDPLTVATAIDGAGVDPSVALTADDDMHRALAGLATFHPRWKSHARAPLDATTLLPIDRRWLDVGDVVFATMSGRVIWFPSYFSANLLPQRRIHKLGHYHRNITLATLQTSSLLDLIRRAVAALDRYPHQSLDRDEFARVKLAAGILGRLYGARGVYTTWSVRHQITPYGDLVSRIRQDLLGWPPLA